MINFREKILKLNRTTVNELGSEFYGGVSEDDYFLYDTKGRVSYCNIISYTHSDSQEQGLKGWFINNELVGISFKKFRKSYAYFMVIDDKSLQTIKDFFTEIYTEKEIETLPTFFTVADGGIEYFTEENRKDYMEELEVYLQKLDIIYDYVNHIAND